MLHDVIYFTGTSDGITVEAAVQYVNEFHENVLGFCNNIYNAEGGTHITGFKTTFTAVMNIFFTGGTAVGEGWLLGHITYEGLTAAIYMVLRIVMLIMGTFLLTYTTSPIALTDGLENLLGPLKKLHLPVHELAMMMSIALRFIPTLIEETDKIMSAQKARGADFESGNIFQRAKALVPILVPLFISAFRRADELATAMECRCYHGGEGRTALHVLRYQAADFVVLVAFVALAAGLIVLKHMGI